MTSSEPPKDQVLVLVVGSNSFLEHFVPFKRYLEGKIRDPGYAEIMKHQLTGKWVVDFRVTGIKNGELAFAALCKEENQPSVHVFKANLLDKSYELLMCNCTQGAPGITGHLFDNTGFSEKVPKGTLFPSIGAVPLEEYQPVDLSDLPTGSVFVRQHPFSVTLGDASRSIMPEMSTPAMPGPTKLLLVVVGTVPYLDTPENFVAHFRKFISQDPEMAEVAELGRNDKRIGACSFQDERDADSAYQGIKSEEADIFLFDNSPANAWHALHLSNHSGLLGLKQGDRVPKANFSRMFGVKGAHFAYPGYDPHCRVYVHNLVPAMDSKALDMFVSTLTSGLRPIRIHMSGGRPARNAELDFKSPEDAQKAIQVLNKRLLANRTISAYSKLM